MRSVRFGLLGSGGAVLVGALAVAACTASGDAQENDDLLGADASTGEEGSALPPPSNPDKDSGPGVDARADAGSKDGGDAAVDAAPPGPVPGSPCKNVDDIGSRSCGKCGKEEAICKPGDGGLVWSEYGPCAGEVGLCLPGSTLACGNCGTQTCTAYCAWGACANQPPQSCSPGTVQFTTAGCPTGGFRTRTCAAKCQWEPYSAVCDTPTAGGVSAGPGSYSTFMHGTDGKLYAWGLDADGQLGDGNTVDRSKIVPTPFSDVVSLQVGGGTTYGFTCAAFGNGSAKCWGYNSTSYTLGDGVTSTSLTGVTPIGFNANVTTMVTGYAHGCGLFADGTAKCWGYNTYGQLGNASTTTSTTPVAVGLAGITQLASGYYTVCALKGDAAHCWGYNNSGQLGDGTIVNKSTTTLVVGSGFASIAPGYYHSCAAMTDGTAKCWGENVNGEIGDGAGGTTSASDVTTPATVRDVDGAGPSLTGVAEVCTGYGLSCARLTDGRVACWGRNAEGQLGIGTVTPSNVPKAVTGVAAATKLACGYRHACAVDGGKVKCWGDNQYGQIGNGGMPMDATTAQSSTF